MKRARLTIAPALALVALIALGATASVRADDLPSELGVLAIEDGTLYGHCITTDDAGHAFVCDPRSGRLLIDDDNFDPITR